MNNDTLENTANEALKGMIEASTSASSWVISELPEVVDQLLKWKFIESLAFFVLGVVLLLSSAIIAGLGLLKIHRIKTQRSKLHSNVWHSSLSGDGEYLATLALCATILAIVSPVIIFGNLDWLQILIAPKVYLIEYASQIL
jgi:hypothetical protein